MRPHAAGLVGCCRLLSVVSLLLIASTASAGSLAGGLKRQVGRGAANATVTAPGIAVPCTDVETGSTFLYQAQHLLSSGAIDAQWIPDTTERCMGSNNGYRGQPIDDGQGGEYFSWVDARSGESDVFAQHLTAAGDTCPGWGIGGLALCAAPHSQYNLDAVGDRQGGLLLAWQDYRSGRNSAVYCLRVTPSGEIASGWSTGGVAVAEGASDQLTPKITADASGGAFVFWLERAATGIGLRAQHLSSSGSPSAGWPAEGIELVPGAQRVAGIAAIADSAGTASLFWRSSPDSNGMVLRYARLGTGLMPDSSWSIGAVSLTGLASASSDPVLRENSDGGLFAAWSELSGTSNALKLERFTREGLVSAGWAPTGVAVISDGVGISLPALLPDGGGGVVVAWEDRRTGSGHIWAQRIQADGTIAPNWEGGTLVCDANGEQHAPMLAPDGNGGLIATWIDDATSASGAFLSSLVAADALPTFLRAETNSGYARLIWTAPASLEAVIRAYREDGDSWSALGPVAVDDSSHLVVEDRNAHAGAFTRYRLSIEASGAEMFLTPVSLLIPNEPTVLELRRAWAPSRSNVVVFEFALPKGPMPRAEIFDITGRRVGDVMLAQFTPGVYRTQVPFETRARSGVFFLRLTQGSKALSRRVVLVR